MSLNRKKLIESMGLFGYVYIYVHIHACLIIPKLYVLILSCYLYIKNYTSINELTKLRFVHISRNLK